MEPSRGRGTVEARLDIKSRNGNCGATGVLERGRRLLYIGGRRGDHLSATKFRQDKRANQTMASYLLDCSLLRRKAEARASMGGAFPDGIAKISSMQNKRSLLLARVQCALEFPIAAQQVRRLFEPEGGSGRQHVLYA